MEEELCRRYECVALFEKGCLHCYAVVIRPAARIDVICIFIVRPLNIGRDAIFQVFNSGLVLSGGF